MKEKLTACGPFGDPCERRPPAQYEDLVKRAAYLESDVEDTRFPQEMTRMRTPP